MKYILPDDNLTFSSKFEVLYFYATWMNFHKRFSRMIESYEYKNNEYKFIAIDVDHHKLICKKFKIEAVPTIVIFVDGIEVKRFIGMILTSAFKSMLSDIYTKYKEKNNVE